MLVYEMAMSVSSSKSRGRDIDETYSGTEERGESEFIDNQDERRVGQTIRGASSRSETQVCRKLVQKVKIGKKVLWSSGVLRVYCFLCM
jgi:hypothetical protein